jgi:hypothetical protein
MLDGLRLRERHSQYRAVDLLLMTNRVAYFLAVSPIAHGMDINQSSRTASKTKALVTRAFASEIWMQSQYSVCIHVPQPLARMQSTFRWSAAPARLRP